MSSASKPSRPRRRARKAGSRLSRLGDVPPQEVLERIRQRQRAGLPMTATAVRGEDLINLARFHFGGWYEAVYAAGLEPQGCIQNRKPPGGGRREMRPLTDALLRGPLSSRELELRTGVRRGTIRRQREGMGIVRDERRKKDRPWLSSYRKLLGKLPDTEIAARAGISPSHVLQVRRELGIPAFVPSGGTPQGEPASLDQVPREEVLRRIRERSSAGLSMRSRDANPRLQALAQFHFGGWYEAVEAAGLKPEATRTRDESHARPARLAKLSKRMLEGPRTSRELERLTGVPRATIRDRRSELGIHRDETPRKDRAWVEEARELFGKVPDAELARRFGVGPMTVGLARRELGIAPCPRAALATSEALREGLRRADPADLDAALRTLGRRAATVLRRRALADQPETLEEIGDRLGITKQSVRWHETQGLARLLLELSELRQRRGGAR